MSTGADTIENEPGWMLIGAGKEQTSPTPARWKFGLVAC